MSFYNEIKEYTIDELKLIISSQKELYSEEEMGQIRSLLEEKIRIKEEEHKSKVIAQLPETILCPKCDGPNSFDNEKCVFCGHTIDKTKYYVITDDKEDEEYQEYSSDDDDNDGNSYTFHYIISFLIPLIGFISGAIMLSNDAVEKRSIGKSCIILAIISIVISAVVSVLFWF